MAELHRLRTGIVLAHFIVSNDVERSRRFYTEVLGGRVVFSGKPSGEPTNVAPSNSWIIINVGGGPTDDKPTVTLCSGPTHAWGPWRAASLPVPAGQVAWLRWRSASTTHGTRWHSTRAGD